MIIENTINLALLKKASKSFKNSDPFDHCVVKNFFLKDFSYLLEKEFPDYEDKLWQEYSNELEEKKLTNNWNHFKPLTYKILCALNSDFFCKILSEITGISPLYSDYGLNGGGWHIHKSGGKLNPHLDYSLHPKLGLQRKLNLIIYLNSSWKENWGGELGLWSKSDSENGPGKLRKVIKPFFNTAIIFDTTQNSWHGILGKLNLPKEQYRKSLALYYLTDPPVGVDKRGKALFAPTDEQKGDKNIEELIKKRSSISGASSVYKK
jgi:Rps23 Pro-64 3,4-dihydroxylase Tpa1-like proline 4-hydroxylase